MVFCEDRLDIALEAFTDALAEYLVYYCFFRGTQRMRIHKKEMILSLYEKFKRLNFLHFTLLIQLLLFDASIKNIAYIWERWYVPYLPGIF